MARKVTAVTNGTVEQGGVTYLVTYFRVSERAANGNEDGEVHTPINVDFTESTFNLNIQQAVADRATAEGGYEYTYLASDVFGGRI